MRGGVLLSDRLLASEDVSQIEILGAAARETLEEALRSGSAEDVAKFWPDVLKGLSVPLEVATLVAPNGTPLATAFLQRASVYLDLLRLLLTSQPQERSRGSNHESHLPDAILASTTFCLIELETSEAPVWTNPDLSRKAQEIISLVGRTFGESPPEEPQAGMHGQDRGTPNQIAPSEALLSGSEKASLQSVLRAHLDTLLLRLHPILRTKAPGSDEASFSGSEEAPRGAAVVAAHQLSFIICSIHSPHLGPVIARAVPSVLTAVDHWAPPVKKQGLRALAHIVENVTVAELTWFGEVIMDALCKTAVGCDEEVWPVALPTLVKATVKIAGRDPRHRWYSHVFSLLLRDMELHYTDTPRRLVWLREIPPLVGALRLFVVGHFKRLMPLLLTWLRAPDAETQIRTLDLLKLVILNTWPRMPAHAERLTNELKKACEEGEPGHGRAEAREKVEEACSLLQRCKDHQQQCQSIAAPTTRA